MANKPVDSSTPQGVGEQTNKAKRQREQELSDMNYMLSDPRGRRFLMRYLEWCGWRKTSFTGNNSETFLLEGQRNVAIKMLDDIMESSNEGFFLMLKESKGELDA